MGSNQPARSFNFGAPQAAPSNRGFQRPAGNACYACGQVGHLQRDCPGRGQPARSQLGNQPAPRKKPVVVPSKADACGVLLEDTRQHSLMWPFTCYAPAFTLSASGDGLLAGSNLVSGDLAFEEARSLIYAASAGGPAATAQAVRSEREYAAKRQSDQHSLLGFDRGRLQTALAEADAGRSLPGSLPPLPWAQPAMLPPPAGLVWAGPQSPLPQPAAAPPLSFPSVSSAAPPPLVLPPLPSGPQQPGSEEETWNAACFVLGHIPESPPPPGVC